MSSKINFIKLTDQELSSKMNILVHNKSRIIFWKTSPRYFEGSVISNNEKLIIKTRDLPIKLLGDQLCLNFKLNNMEYFIKGTVAAHHDSNEEIEVIISKECFRVEKRDRERLQLYPFHTAFVYIKYAEEKQENIFFLNKNEQKKNDLFSNIKDLEKQKLTSLSRELETQSDEELIGFRVEDISATGLCFLVSQKEKEHILVRFMDAPFKMHFSLGDTAFSLEDVKIVYQINYINQQFSGVPMFKIGVTFKSDANLTLKIQELIGRDDKLLDYQKEFEEFIKNE